MTSDNMSEGWSEKAILDALRAWDAEFRKLPTTRFAAMHAALTAAQAQRDKEQQDAK